MRDRPYPVLRIVVVDRHVDPHEALVAHRVLGELTYASIRQGTYLVIVGIDVRWGGSNVDLLHTFVSHHQLCGENAASRKS
jgi:hypothetical protein